ncbi:hypothetical protein [Neisseria dentiae]|uniref:hypothetical protein n=1 Tax=Neisseria dentiae TaxID=194197 RepID=UPI00146D47CD|nr:hypothetical protein [Neisseria dentiae]QMT44153.1 hypothetical protein H3L92_02250 [Neisseria dentiae]
MNIFFSDGLTPPTPLRPSEKRVLPAVCNRSTNPKEYAMTPRSNRILPAVLLTLALAACGQQQSAE